MLALEHYDIFTEGDTLYQAMLTAIGAAQKTICLESYIFGEDIGWEFAKALTQKAKEGIKVQLVIDAAGIFFYRTGKLLKFIEKNGVQLELFHRWTWKNPLRYNRRNHRKLLIVDNQKIFLGGFNIHNASSKRFSGEARWLDCHITFKDILTTEANKIFNAAWQGYADEKEDYDPNTILKLLPEENHLVPKHLRDIYTHLWPKAKRYIYLITPYLVPDRMTQRALMSAASRGIDVKILVPSQGNHKLTAWAARAAYANLLHNGVRLYEYTPRMLHAKVFIMDDTWSSIGSANMDYRSFFLNYELNLFTRTKTVCTTLRENFESYITDADEVLSVKWPSRHWSKKLTELIGWFARRWL